MTDSESDRAVRGAPMDYEEHERTYAIFTKVLKYGTMHVVFVLIALAAGFFTSASFLFSILLFIALSISGLMLL